MIPLFINIRIIDAIDIILVAFIMYKAYMLIRETVALNIFVGVFSFYMLWLLVRAFDMQLLTTILAQIIGVGVIALIVVFQQEIRRFLLLVGSKYFSKELSLSKIFTFGLSTAVKLNIKSIVVACENMSEKKIGALIVVTHKFDMAKFSNIGDTLNANLSSRLLETIFAKDTPLHDGAVVIVNNKIMAARCVLPISESPNLPMNLGMRHRAALGMSEHSNAVIITVSEQTGKISFAKAGVLTQDISLDDLNYLLETEFH